MDCIRGVSAIEGSGEGLVILLFGDICAAVGREGDTGNLCDRESVYVGFEVDCNGRERRSKLGN